MNFADALKALYQGKKIRRKAWSINTSYQLKNGAFITLNTKDLLADDWEAADREDLLSKKEKECLENLRSLYLDNYDFAFEKELIHKQYFLKIFIFPRNSDEKAETRVKPKPETLTEFFISEYCALKEENARLKEEAEYWKVCTDRNIERYEIYADALKALDIVMDGTDRISAKESIFFPTTKGYEELKKYLELQKRIDQNDDETD